MSRPLLIAVLVSALAVLSQASSAEAMELFACRYARSYPWHGGYYNVSWGMPVALVVPPTVGTQTRWGWGVGNVRVTPICHQFQRGWPGPVGYDPRMFRPTPRWPSDTEQFGIYYVRGPW